MRIRPWKDLLPTAQDGKIRRSKRTRTQVVQDQWRLLHALVGVVSGQWTPMHRIRAALADQYPSDLHHALVAYEGVIFERLRVGRYVSWRRSAGPDGTLIPINPDWAPPGCAAPPAPGSV